MNQSFLNFQQQCRLRFMNTPDPNRDTHHEQLEQLEMKLCFLDDTVETLNAIVVKQQQTIDLLQQQMAWLYQQLKALNPVDIEPFSVQGDVPPHY